MARALTSRQHEALEALDRATYFRVKIEDPDGAMIDVRDVEGYDLFSHASIVASVEQPISTAEVVLWREADPGDGGPLYSLAPLIEASLFNRDAGGSYAPIVGLTRRIELDIATMLQGEEPDSGDYESFWEGYIDDIEWGGLASRVVLPCRDPLSRLNDTMIEGVHTYGGGSPLTPVQDVIQQILDDHMGSGEFELVVVGDPDFGILEEDFGECSVLTAVMSLVDRLGWNFHWRWQESPGEFRPTLYQAIRDRASLSGFTPDWTFGPSSYYDLPGVRLSIAGVRTAGEVVYRDLDGAQQKYSEERSSQVAEFRRRFARFDEREFGQIRTESQAQNYLSSVLDDLSVPPLLQKVDAPIHWPIELCDVCEFEPNDVHYDTTQTLAVFGYQHLIQPKRIRTMIDTSGQPSGGYRRWLEKEVVDVARTGVLHVSDESGRDVTGTTASTTLQVAPVPAGTFLPGRTIIIGSDWDLTGTAGNKILRMDYGSGSFLLQIIPAAITGRVTVDIEMTLTPLVSGAVQGIARKKITLPSGAVQIDDDHVGLSVMADQDFDFGAQLVDGADTVALAISRLEVR